MAETLPTDMIWIHAVLQAQCSACPARSDLDLELLVSAGMLVKQGVLRCSQSSKAKSLGTHFFSSAYEPIPQYLQNALAADLINSKRTAGQPLLQCMPCIDHQRVASTHGCDCTGVMPAIMLLKPTAMLTVKLRSNIGPCVHADFQRSKHSMLTKQLHRLTYCRVRNTQPFLRAFDATARRGLICVMPFQSWLSTRQHEAEGRNL